MVDLPSRQFTLIAGDIQCRLAVKMNVGRASASHDIHARKEVTQGLRFSAH